MFKLDAADVKATDLYFICVEAKRQQTVDEQSGKAQLLAQIHALQIQRFFLDFKKPSLTNRGNKPITGALTDGFKWSFWHNFNEGWYFEQLNTRSLDEAMQVLSMPLFVKVSNLIH